MNLIEKLSVALLCFTISLPLCYGMDSSQKDEKHKIESRSTLPSKEAERLYQEAFINLEQQIYNNKPKDSSPFIQLSRAAQLGHPLAHVLVTLVITSMKVEHVGWDPHTEKNLVKLHYFFGHYEEGFMSLLPLLKQGDNEIKTLVNEILKDEKVIADFFTRLQFVNGDKTLSNDDALEIKRVALYCFFQNDHSSFKIFDMKDSTFSLIASLYISNSDNDQFLLSEGLKFCIFAAGRCNQQAYEMLLKTLQVKNAYELYYRQLFVFLLGEEEWAENLFNRIAFADEKANLHAYKYLLNAQKNGEGAIANCLKNIMKKHNEFKEAKPTSVIHTPVSQSLQKDYIAGEAPVKGIVANEKPKTPQEQFNIALNLQGSNPLEAIKIYTAIVESDVPISNTLNKRINTQLEIIGKKCGYNKNQIKELLDRKKGSQITTSPAQGSKNLPSISSFPGKRSPVTIKNKQGSITTPPISLTLKEETGIKKKPPQKYTPEELCELGASHSQEGFQKEALRYFEEAAALGSARAQCVLGGMYRSGVGCSRDPKKALEYLKASAAQEYPAALFNLGNMYLTGDGVDHDLEAAFNYYQRGAKTGHPESQYNLGNMYFERGNITGAFKYYKLAADQNIAEAQYSLAGLYKLGYLNDMDHLESATQCNPTKEALECARDLFKKAYDNGHGKAKEGLDLVNCILERNKKIRANSQKQSFDKPSTKEVKPEEGTEAVHTSSLNGTINPQNVISTESNVVPTQKTITSATLRLESGNDSEKSSKRKRKKVNLTLPIYTSPSDDSLGDVSQAEASETVEIKAPTKNKGTKRRITKDKEEDSLINESAQSESEASSKSETSTSSHRKLTKLSKRKPRNRDEKGSGTTLNDLTENQRSNHNLIGNTSNLPKEVNDSLEIKTPTKVSKTLKLTEESSHKKEKEKKKKREKSANQIHIKDYIKSDAKKKRHKIERQLASRDEEINSFSTRSTNSTSSLSDAESSSHSETSTSSYKELTKLSKRRSSNLDEKTIRKTLEKLQRNGKANCDLEGGKIGGTPTNIRDERLTIHTTHGKHGRKWHERPEVVNQFYDFVVSCDDSLSETIEEIKSNK